MSEVAKIQDDKELLELMLADHLSAPEEFAATARWLQYSNKFVEFLRTDTLDDFRGRHFAKDDPGRVLRSFGAADKNPSFNNISPEQLYHVAASSFDAGNGLVPLYELEANKVGAPEGFEVGGQFYTLSWLNYYCRYAFVTKHIRFEKQVIVEVGPGAGKQAEMLKRAHPDLTIVLFDLPTQLYVCSQYLSAALPGEVVGYRQGRTVGRFSDIEAGKINILPHWKFPILKDVSFDLLWNAASFQEMDGTTAKVYLGYASQAKHMYLMHNIKFKDDLPPRGVRGVVRPAVISNHKEISREGATMALRPSEWLYYDSLWEKTAPEKANLKGVVRRILRRAGL